MKLLWTVELFTVAQIHVSYPIDGTEGKSPVISEECTGKRLRLSFVEVISRKFVIMGPNLNVALTGRATVKCTDFTRWMIL